MLEDEVADIDEVNDVAGGEGDNCDDIDDRDVNAPGALASSPRLL